MNKNKVDEEWVKCSNNDDAFKFQIIVHQIWITEIWNAKCLRCNFYCFFSIDEIGFCFEVAFETFNKLFMKFEFLSSYSSVFWLQVCHPFFCTWLLKYVLSTFFIFYFWILFIVIVFTFHLFKKVVFRKRWNSIEYEVKNYS